MQGSLTGIGFYILHVSFVLFLGTCLGMLLSIGTLHPWTMGHLLVPFSSSLPTVCSYLLSDFLFHVFPHQCCPKVNRCLTWSGYTQQCSGLTLALSVLRNHFWGFTGIICAAKDQTLVIYFKARVLTPVLSLLLH